jgi:hypothetical protein
VGEGGAGGVGRGVPAALSPEAFQVATAAGRALAPDQALRVALG